MKAQARHILVKTADEAEKLKQRIANGEAFDVLAKKFSICPSGKRGGDLGEVRPGQMVGALDQVIFKKPLRVVHGPIKSKFGYHLVQTFYREGQPQGGNTPPSIFASCSTPGISLQLRQDRGGTFMCRFR